MATEGKHCFVPSLLVDPLITSEEDVAPAPHTHWSCLLEAWSTIASHGVLLGGIQCCPRKCCPCALIPGIHQSGLKQRRSWIVAQLHRQCTAKCPKIKPHRLQS
eukprot:1161041-Pelagomonas_calceolata.AAC.4